MDIPLYPLLFKPVYKDYVWGGTRIAATFNRAGVPPICAESWELSPHADGPSVVADGPLAGLSLAELAQRYGAALVGSRAADPNRFPLLFKLIDAKQKLSVQIHPSEATAGRSGGDPKTEMWVVLDCQPGASLYAGLKPGIDAAGLRQALADGRGADCLIQLPVRPGDTLFIPGGLVHAIGAGCLIYEVQQNSNTTYRLYDWDRVGTDGRPRPLHIDQAFAAIDWSLPLPSLRRGDPLGTGTAPNTWHEILATPFFRMRQLHLTQPETLTSDGSTFQTLFVKSGTVSATVSGMTVNLPCGASCLIPAAAAFCRIEPHGEAKLYLTTLPL